MSLISVWDGSSSTRPDPSVFRAPDAADYARIVEELRKTQQSVVNMDEVYIAEAGENVNIGQLARIRNTDNKLIKADSSTSGLVCGLVLVPAAVGEDAIFVQDGKVSLESWIDVTGTTHLSPGLPYYLGPSGTISTMPATVGWHVRVGLAVGFTTLALKISESVRL